jgi:UMF1 family MFS transporter
VTSQEAKPRRLSVASWVLYDLANTIFALGVVGVYFSDWLVSEGLADSALSLVQVAAAIVVIFAAPWVGARSDVRGTRVPALIAITVAAVSATSLLALGPVALTLLMLWVAIISVNIGSVVYDALLVDVSTSSSRGWVSGLGVGVGYFGSFIGLGIGVVALDILGWSHAATFRSLALGFLVFALPAFFFIEEREGSSTEPLPGIRDIVRGLIGSWRTAARYEGVTRFLIGRFLYTDAINTLIGGFLAIFVLQELDLDRTFFTTLMAIAIAAAIVGGLGAGWFIERVGPLAVLRFVLVIWMVAMASGIAAAVTDRPELAWVIGPLGGVALGATWSSDRVVMTRVSPPRRLGEFYGLYATVGRFATIAGPLVWAIVVDALGLGRNFALGALIAFVFAGWWTLRKIDDKERDWPPEDRRLSGNRRESLR